MLRGMIERDILNGASVIDEVSNVKSRLKEHYITFFLLALARFGSCLFRIVQTLFRSISIFLHLLNWDGLRPFNFRLIRLLSSPDSLYLTGVDI